MNVASLKLSKKLYELSGWEDCDWAWGCDGFFEEIPVAMPLRDCDVCPAYDCGYLLRKLQDPELDWPTDLTYCHHQDGSRNYCATYMELPFDSSNQPPFAYADTPEDALCRLAIKLFEEGIL